MIIDKLDARTATTTTILSKQWRNLPTHSHTCYDLAVDDILPPHYHRLKQITLEAKAGYEAEKNALKLAGNHASRDRLYAVKDWMSKVRPLTPILQRYERWAMRRYVKRVNAFLLAPNNVQQRSIQKLRLQACGTSNFTDQWITEAIGRWGVEDLELVTDKSCWLYDFRLLNGCKNVQLKRLVLSNCYHEYAPYSLTFQRLTALTLCKKSAHISHAYFVLRNCMQLVDLRLKHSSCDKPYFHINFPLSKLKSLQLDNYNIERVHLTSLPCLETFACRGQPTILFYGEVPQLRHVSLDFLQTGGNGGSSGSNRMYALSKSFLGIPPLLEYLVLQLRGHEMWVDPFRVPKGLNHLKKLFIANIPMNWDIFWILRLLAVTPTLESFHVHFDNNSEEIAAGPPGVQLQLNRCRQHQYHLKELGVIGFDGVAWQTSLVNQIMRSSPMLERVHLLDGHVVEDEERELVGLEIVRRRREWHECERSEVLEDLTVGIRSPHPEIVLE